LTGLAGWVFLKGIEFARFLTLEAISVANWILMIPSAPIASRYFFSLELMEREILRCGPLCGGGV